MHKALIDANSSQGFYQHILCPDFLKRNKEHHEDFKIKERDECFVKSWLQSGVRISTWSGPQHTSCSKPVKRAKNTSRPIFTRAESAVWIIKIRKHCRKKAPECTEIKIIQGTSATKWSETSSRGDNRVKTWICETHKKGIKKWTVRKHNYHNDELNKVIKGSWRCRERGGGTFDVGECRQTTSRLRTSAAPLDSTRLFNPPAEICGGKKNNNTGMKKVANVLIVYWS